jgi:phosphatidylserine/phosphatidylglycerophosphate/cardiolipin synthase-like enzyme
VRRHRSLAAIGASVIVCCVLLLGLALAGATALPDGGWLPPSSDERVSSGEVGFDGRTDAGSAAQQARDVGVTDDEALGRSTSAGRSEAAPTARTVPDPSAFDGGNGSGGRILSVYPNPVPRGDAGEFVLVRTGPGNWTLSDGEATVSVPARPGRVAVSPAPDRARPLVAASVHRIPDAFSLANGGETLHLRRNGTVVDRTTYRSAPEAERWVRTAGRSSASDGGTADARSATGDWRWRPIGATAHVVTTTRSANVTAFVLPDEPAVPLRTVRSAEERLWVAAYTFESRRIADALRRAHERGVDVRLLVEGGPVGGITRRSASLLDRLNRSGVSVRAVSGPYARYEFHHSKYAVVDDAALVTTENWKPSGTGGRSNRGWGAVVHDGDAAGALSAVFRGDYRWRAATPWAEYRRGRRFEPDDSAPGGSYPSRIAAEHVRARSVSVAVAPETAGQAVIAELRSANRSIDVVQAAIDDGRLLRETIRAAERGVQVRILLSGAWYTADDNRALAERLNRRAERADLPLAARVASGGDRFQRIHAKGVVIDDRTAIVGSLNWNAHARTENREVVLVLRGPEVGRYFAAAFQADWSGGGSPLPVGLTAVALLVIGAAAWALRRFVTVDARDGIGP